MARKVDATAAVVDQQTLIEGVAKYFLEKVYGPEGMPWGTRFADLEELSVQIGQAMSRSMIDQALARQAQAVPSEAETCSGCGGQVEPIDDTEPRAGSRSPARGQTDLEVFVEKLLNRSDPEAMNRSDPEAMIAFFRSSSASA